jgi:prophage maintenance system killer protein
MNKGGIEIFQSEDGNVQLSVTLDKETAWLSLDQMTSLFDRDKSVISRHIRSVFQEGESSRDSVVAKNATTAADGKVYQVDYYNLDVVISVGYRVKSRRGVQFRQWATRVLHQHLVDGYTLNERRLRERGIEFEQAVDLLARTLKNQELVDEHGADVLRVVSDYARSWTLLQAYDEQTLKPVAGKQDSMRALELDSVLSAVAELKKELMRKGEASELFGQLRGEGLHSPLATIEQTFGGEPLYPNVATRAANLLYFVIKNHPLADGNKRTGSFLFLWYLRLNEALLGKPVDALVNDNTLVALGLCWWLKANRFNGSFGRAFYFAGMTGAASSAPTKSPLTRACPAKRFGYSFSKRGTRPLRHCVTPPLFYRGGESSCGKGRVRNNERRNYAVFFAGFGFSSAFGSPSKRRAMIDFEVSTPPAATRTWPPIKYSSLI